MKRRDTVAFGAASGIPCEQQKAPAERSATRFFSGLFVGGPLMKIIKIEILRIAVPFTADEHAATQVASDDAFNAASPDITRMESLLVRLTSDDGREGWGEAFGHGINPVTFTALEKLVAPFFLGTELDQRQQTYQQALRAFHGFGRTGAVLYAVSAIDIALWDIAAQVAGRPLYAFLGAPSRELELYASLVSYGNDPQDVARQVSRVHALGYRRLKLHETAPEAIAAARSALPPEAQLMVDVNCPWQVEQAHGIASQLRELGLTWLEEPVWPPDDFAGLARVREAGVPIAAGENASGIEGFRQLLQSGAVDVAQPSVAKIGGVTGMLEAIASAREIGVYLVPHCFYFGPGLLAAAHLTATLGADVALEVPFVQFEDNLHPFLDFQPRMSLPDVPGLGFVADPVFLERYQIDRVELTHTH